MAKVGTQNRMTCTKVSVTATDALASATDDLPDGRQIPPLGDGWHAVDRITRTQSRRIALLNPDE